MSKRLFQFLVILIALTLLHSVAFASVGVQQNGVRQGAAIDLNFTGSVEIDSDGSIVDVNIGKYQAYELAVSGDTLTTSDSGKIIVYANSTASTAGRFYLPSAVTSDTLTTAALNFTFVTTDGANLTVKPVGTDLIVFPAMEAGDTLISPGASGDTLGILCPTTGKWVIMNRTGTWTRGDE